MKGMLVDTDILSLFLRGHERVVDHFTGSCDISAEIYARLRRAGKTLEDIDLLIAGIALDNDLGVATRNTDHFERIQELTVENWAN